MPIDFFAVPCGNPNGNCQSQPVKCCSEISIDRFGISDRDSDSRIPASIRLTDDDTWDFTVFNPTGKAVSFKAVDYCVDSFRAGSYALDNPDRTSSEFSSDSTYIPGKELIKRCEGFLKFDGKILFLEIKSRPRGKWLVDAREKFEETILSFKEHHPDLVDRILKPIVSNSKFNRLHQNEMVQRRILKDKVGLEFSIQQSVSI